MKYFWFGDSWVFGDELQSGKTFAQIVSDIHNAECINLAQCGSSLDDIPYIFFHHLDAISNDDTVFFCLTASHRVSFFESGQLKRIMPTEMYLKHQPHPFWRQWYRYFDSPEQRSYNRDKTINLLYYWCLARGINSWFCNIFTQDTNKLIDTTPDTSWLLPRNECLAGCILPVIGQDNLYLADNENLTHEQWNQQQIAIDKFIRPNFTHPNSNGHQHIAQKIIEKYNQHA